jgi:5-methylcytosine-specific restriction endonuclease McrA
MSCGKAGEEIHHIQFKSKGGDNKPNNLILLCRKCHSKQHSYTGEQISVLKEKVAKNEKSLRRRLV